MDVLVFSTRLKHLFPRLYRRLALHVRLSATGLKHHSSELYRRLALHVHPFWLHLLYLLLLGSLGFLLLLLCHRRLGHAAPGFLDLFYMSVSASTVTGLNSVELESLSLPQVAVLTLLMLAGGEVFLSLLGLALRTHKLELVDGPVADSGSTQWSNRVEPESAIELGLAGHSVPPTPEQARYMKCRCLAYLTRVVVLYHVTFHALGAGAVALYLRHAPSARGVLRAKGFPPIPFAISLAVSAFANGGIVPTNENMSVFVENSGLLLTVAVLILVGNTLFSSMLRAIVAVLGRFSDKEEVKDMLRSPEKLSFEHLHPKRRAVMVAAMVAGVWTVQLGALLAMGWNRGYYFQGLSPFQRVASGAFQATNARHCGMSTVDVAEVPPAALVVVMWAMYLPSYMSFLPFEEEEEHPREEEPRKGIHYWLKIANLPQISYIAIFMAIVCIIEREKMSNDPINFNIFFVAFEVVSAYGNVGFSTGYSCQRQLIPNSSCKNMFISLSGKWSNLGKLMIIFVMIFGRLKRFHRGGGKAWRN